MKKKFLALFVTVAVSVSLFTGCGSAVESTVSDDLKNAEDDMEIALEDVELDLDSSVEERSDVSNDNSVEENTDVSVTNEDDMYVIDRITISDTILKEFFNLHLGCYVDWALGNCKTEPINISTMLEHTGVVGAFILDDGMRVVADYSDNLFNLQINMSQSMLSAMSGKKSMNYGCYVGIRDINMPDTFKYYKGTDAEIGVIAELHYFIDEQEVDFYNNYAVVLLSNNRSNPADWLVKSAFLITKQDYESLNGDVFSNFLIDENVDTAEISSVDWKQSYVDWINSVDYLTYYDEGYCLQDINGDNVPEIFLLGLSNFEITMLVYIDKNSNVNYISGYAYYDDKVLDGGDRVDYGSDYVYQYDTETGIYNLIFSGNYDVESITWNHTNFTVDGQSCSEDEYNAQLTSVWDADKAIYLWDKLRSFEDKSLIEAIEEY